MKNKTEKKLNNIKAKSSTSAMSIKKRYKLTLETLKDQMKDGNHDGRYNLFINIIKIGLNEAN
jgi:hypothetical protein